MRKGGNENGMQMRERRRKGEVVMILDEKFVGCIWNFSLQMLELNLGGREYGNNFIFYFLLKLYPSVQGFQYILCNSKMDSHPMWHHM